MEEIRYKDWTIIIQYQCGSFPFLTMSYLKKDNKKYGFNEEGRTLEEALNKAKIRIDNNGSSQGK